MIPLAQMRIIQIDITNACMNRCSNCTRFTGHHRRPFFMDMETFRRAVDSLVDFPGMVGMIGGEPLLHPDFAAMAEYLAKRITDKKRRGIWSTVPKVQGERYGGLIREVFGNFYFQRPQHRSYPASAASCGRRGGHPRPRGDVAADR